MGMNDEEIWQSDHKGHKGESCYRVGYGEVNDLGGEDKTLFKLHENFCPPVQVVLHPGPAEPYKQLMQSPKAPK